MNTELPTENSLRAGAAQIEITPWAGVHMAGDITRRRSANLVADPLFARAVVFESQGRKLCLLSMDLTIITRPYSQRIRQAAAQWGFDPEAVLVHVTQTHTAPACGHFMVHPDFEGIPEEYDWLRGSNEQYNELVVERAVQAIRDADQALQPVRVAADSGVEGRLAWNRRAIGRDGRVRMPPPRWEWPRGPTGIRYLEGPIDPEVGVVCIQDYNLKMVGMLLHYTCHPVNVFPKPIVSADWPGAWVQQMQAAYGQQCVPLVLNGCCGNINPWAPYDPDHVPDHRRMGCMLAETTQRVAETVEFTDQAVLDWRSKHLAIPLREIDSEQLRRAEDILGQSPQPVWTDESKTRVDHEWMTAASLYSLHLLRQRNSALDYHIQALRIGDIAIVGLPGEPFVEGGLKIKLDSPTFPTYVAHCCSHYVGYIPTREAVARGGYEVDTSYWSPLVPEALDMIATTAVELLEEMFGD